MTAPGLSDESRLREEICRVGRSLFERGYAHATAGNISVRLEDGFLITPTDACLGTLDPVRLARLDLQGAHLAGDPASKTLALHRRIYAAAPDARPRVEAFKEGTLGGLRRAREALPELTKSLQGAEARQKAAAA